MTKMEIRIPARPQPARSALTLHIDRIGSRYKAVLSGEGVLRWSKTELGVSQRDLEEFNSLLRAGLERVADSIGSLADLERDPDGPLADLARFGEVVFTNLFPERAAQDMIRSNLRRGGLIEIASEEFLLPWELLYTQVTRRPSISNFWGVRCIVARLPFMRPGDEFPDFARPAPNRLVIATERPQLGLIVSDSLESVLKLEIPSFVRLDQKGSIQLSRLPALRVTDRRTGLGDFSAFLGGERDLLHLACHAEDATIAPESTLEISTDFPIRMVDLGNAGCRIGSGAFVMLNACRTGTMNPATVFNWASIFLHRGASGVLATEFRVLDDFAARFAERFYDYFLCGTPVGEAVLRTRRDFWSKECNPLGLGYSLYSSPDIRIQTT